MIWHVFDAAICCVSVLSSKECFSTYINLLSKWVRNFYLVVSECICIYHVFGTNKWFEQLKYLSTIFKDFYFGWSYIIKQFWQLNKLLGIISFFNISTTCLPFFGSWSLFFGTVLKSILILFWVVQQKNDIIYLHYILNYKYNFFKYYIVCNYQRNYIYKMITNAIALVIIVYRLHM